jgi:hypothetical protein
LENDFTILKTVNHFSKLNSSSLHASLISDYWNLAMVGRRNPDGTEIQQHPATGILPTLESGNIQSPSSDAGEPDSSRNWPESGHGQKPAGSGQNGRDPVGFGLIQRSSVGIRSFWSDPAKHACWNPTTATGRCRIPAVIAFSLFVIFSCNPNTEKYF